MNPEEDIEVENYLVENGVEKKVEDNSIEVENYVVKDGLSQKIDNDLIEEQQQSNVVKKFLKDEQNLKSFVGKNYDKIATKNFSFAGFFFSSGYLIYRKMYHYGIILMILQILLLTIIPNIIVGFILNLFINIMCGLLIKSVYINFSKDKVKKLKNKFTIATDDEMLLILKYNGGTNITLSIIITILIVSIFSIFLIKYNYNLNENGFNFGNREEQQEIEIQPDFNQQQINEQTPNDIPENNSVIDNNENIINEQPNDNTQMNLYTE